MISNKKDWSTKGEVLGKERPKDSLLTKAMDFELGLKAPPIPDREFTDKLENMIKQRIIDDLFDDPIKKDIINLNEQKKFKVHILLILIIIKLLPILLIKIQLR